MERNLRTSPNMKALFTIFLSLSMILGPFETTALAQSSPSANAQTSLYGKNLNQYEHEQIFLESLRDRTRLFEMINYKLFDVENQCIHRNPLNWSQISIVNQGDCKQIVSTMYEQIHANYPDVRILYVIYNLLNSAKRFILPRLIQSENLAFGTTHAGAAIDHFLHPTGSVPEPLKYLSFIDPLEGLLQFKWSGYMDVTPLPSDYQQAATNYPYGSSFTDYMENYCHTFITSHPADARGVQNPQAICSQFRLVYNTQTKSFSFPLTGQARNSYGQILTTEAERNLFFKIYDYLVANLGAMKQNARQQLLRVIRTTPYVILLKSANPTLTQLKNAVLRIDGAALSSANKFEREYFMWLNEKNQPVDPRDVANLNSIREVPKPYNRAAYMKLLDPQEVVLNLLKYPSIDMIEDPANYVAIAKHLTRERAANLKSENRWINAGLLVGTVAVGTVCGLTVGALTKNPELASSSCAVLTEVANFSLFGYFLWNSYSTLNNVFADVFGSQQIGSLHSYGLNRSDFAKYDPTVTDPQFNVHERMLANVDMLNEAQQNVLWNWAFLVGGYALAGLQESLWKSTKVVVKEKVFRGLLQKLTKRRLERAAERAVQISSEHSVPTTNVPAL